MKKAQKHQERTDLLRAEYETMSEALQTVEEKEEEEDVCQIRFAGQRGKPVTDKFIRHCRTLLATGSSARLVREQLFLNAGFVLVLLLYLDSSLSLLYRSTNILIKPLNDERH